MNPWPLVTAFRRVLPESAERDNVGSLYCVRRLSVDVHNETFKS
jgi:hypothetical protein